MLQDEMKTHLLNKLIPFWERLRDEEYGGYYGFMDSDLQVDEKAVKGCILNSRILWFFSNACMCLGEEAPDNLRGYADSAYRFLRDHCLDLENGGVYWSVTYDGKPDDTTKHTYNQAFAVYALSSYYRAFHEEEAFLLATYLVVMMEAKCFDQYGYKEAQSREFRPIANDKLSENGVMADRTMNTLLHVLEAYTEYVVACRERAEYVESAGGNRKENVESAGGNRKENVELADGSRKENVESAVGSEKENVELAGGNRKENMESAAGNKLGNDKSGNDRNAGKNVSDTENMISDYGAVAEHKLRWILNLVEKKVYNPAKRRQEVFFDNDMNSLIDLHSYGHDIEAAWLMDRCLDVLGTQDMLPRHLPPQPIQAASSRQVLAAERKGNGLADSALGWRMRPILRSLEEQVYISAYHTHSLDNECERGVTDTKRIWWVQAEAVVGFYNACQRTGEEKYRAAAEDIWNYIKEHIVDARPDGEWFWYTTKEGAPAMEKPIVEPWKCPYHNGRMCMEIMKRTGAWN